MARFIDRPKLDVTNYAYLILLLVFIVFVFYMGTNSQSSTAWAAGLSMTFLFVATYAPLYYCRINTVYEVDDSQLRIRAGFYKKNIDLETITRIEVEKGYVSSYKIYPPAVKYKNVVWLNGKFGRIPTTPQDLDGFIEALQERVPDLEIKELRPITFHKKPGRRRS